MAATVKLIGFFSVLLLLVGSPSHALNIELHDLGGASSQTPAGKGFIAAAEIWESLLHDPITVNLQVGFAPLDPNILGSTHATLQAIPYSDVREALFTDRQSPQDESATLHLQMNDNLKFLSNTPQGSLFLDNDGSNNNHFLAMNTANLKALHLEHNMNLIDGSITFSNTFPFDFDRSNGISAGLFDFVGIALHEIGHALGFLSGSDVLDYYSGNGPGRGQIASFNPFAIFGALDLFRFSQASLAHGEGVMDLAFRDRAQYLSIDGGKTMLLRLSTGVYHGDGFQMSHWKDNIGAGIMDPTFSPGELGQFSISDLLAFDIIGFDLQILEIPVPNTLYLGLFGILLCFLMTRSVNKNAKRT